MEAAHGILWLKLSQESKQRLQTLFPPRYDNSFYDHITLAFNTTKSDVSGLIGKEAKATVYAHAYNEKVEAVRVTTYDLPDTYGVPHITLSTKGDSQPFESVAMLKGEHTETPIEPTFEIEGILEFIEL